MIFVLNHTKSLYPSVYQRKCRRRDSNPQGLLHQILSLARLPISPPRLVDSE